MVLFNYFELYKKYMLVVGVAGGLLFYLQAFRIFRLKSAQAVSLSGFLLSAISTLSWVIYGYLLGDSTVLISNFFGFLGCVLVVVGKMIYD